MLLTAAWAGSLAIGKCDLGSSGEAIEGTGYGKVKCFNQVETVFFQNILGFSFPSSREMYYNTTSTQNDMFDTFLELHHSH